MKEINIAKTIVAKRKEKGITQDELAAYIGVSKASVSKWETGQSYPDITFLPQLATYFNISIDELIGYSPQMTKEDIRKLYHGLSEGFSKRPFDEVINEYRASIRKYYSCFPLLMQMAVLMVNHYMLAKDKELQESLLQEVIDLCVRIKNESEDVWLSKQANSIEAMCYMILQKPQQVLELLDGTMRPVSGDETILANVYYMTGDLKKADMVLQVSMYQNLLAMLGSCPTYLLLHASEPNRFEEILKRMLSVTETFKVNSLHPNTAARLYLAASQGYMMHNNHEKALDMLNKYVEVCTTEFFPLKLHGDDYFDSIEQWFKEFDLGTEAPRDEKVVKEGMIQAVTANPVFLALAEQPRYKSIIETMKTKLGGN